MYYAYVLKSKKDNSLYIGLTKNLKKRIEQHSDGNGYTKGHLPYKLVFYSAFSSKLIAASFEKYLKSASGKAFINKHLI